MVRRFLIHTGATILPEEGVCTNSEKVAEQIRLQGARRPGERWDREASVNIVEAVVEQVSDIMFVDGAVLECYAGGLLEAKTPEQILQAINKLHKNLGHPTKKVLSRLLECG